MKKKSIKTDFSKVRDADLSNDAHTIDTSMTGNENFHTVEEEKAIVHEASVAFTASLVAVASGSYEARAIKDASRAVLVKAIRVLGIKINLEADGDEARLLTTGFPLNTGKAGKAGPVLVETLYVNADPGHGNMALEVDKVDGAVCYLFECTLAPATAGSVWDLYPCVKPVVHITGLQSRVEYAFRVAVVGKLAGCTFTEPVNVYTV